MKAPQLFGSLCLRADGGPEIGIGHVLRCLSIAQAWKDRGGRVLLVTAGTTPPDVVKLMEAESITIVPLTAPSGSQADAVELLEAATVAGADWIVLDGYHFPRSYHRSLGASGIPVLLIDDLAGEEHYHCDALLNPNAYAEPSLYSGLTGSAHLLLGVSYSLLRRCFAGLRGAARPAAEQAQRILVTFGGSDPRSITECVMNALAEFREWPLQVQVIAGPANPNVARLRDALPALQRFHDAELLVNPGQLPERMSWADLALTAAGSTCWELACLGVPMLTTVAAQNQAGVARKLSELGIAEIVETGADAAVWRDAFVKLASSQEQRARMSLKSRALVDGRGAGRVAETLGTHPVTLRPALESDARRLWEWANEPTTRQVSFCPDAIPWENHLRWLARMFEDDNRRLFIIQSGGDDIGQVRFDREGRGATISLGLAPTARGRGLGPRAARHGAARVLLDGWADSVLALVKPDNEASIRTFRRAGFELMETCIIQGHHAQAWKLRL